MVMTINGRTYDYKYKNKISPRAKTNLIIEVADIPDLY